MKTICRKAIIAIICCSALPLTLVVHTAEEAPTESPTERSLASGFQEGLKNKVANIKSAMKSSNIKKGIKVKLIKIDNKERKKLWTFQVIDPNQGNAVVGKPTTFSKDKIVTFDPNKEKQILQVFADSKVSGAPAAFLEIIIKNGDIQNHNITNPVLAVSKGQIRWLAQDEATKIIEVQTLQERQWKEVTKKMAELRKMLRPGQLAPDFDTWKKLTVRKFADFDQSYLLKNWGVLDKCNDLVKSIVSILTALHSETHKNTLQKCESAITLMDAIQDGVRKSREDFASGFINMDARLQQSVTWIQKFPELRDLYVEIPQIFERELQTAK